MVKPNKSNRGAHCLSDDYSRQQTRKSVAFSACADNVENIFCFCFCFFGHI